MAWFQKKRVEDNAALILPRKLSRLDADVRLLMLNKLA
jgi:hypothetical protein